MIENMYEEQYLIKIIKYLLNATDSSRYLEQPTEMLDWTRLLRIAKRHSLGSLLYHVLPQISKELQPPTDIKDEMSQLAMNAAASDIKQKVALAELEREFEDHHLCFMAVKGSHTKNYYPKSEFRTMGDLDVLYKDVQHKEVKELLSKLGFDGFESGLKHDHYQKTPFITLEMHRGLVAANTIAEAYYEDIWQRAKKDDEKEYIYCMTLEDQYVYTMIHLLEHFKEGGVGIRFVMDIYVFLQQKELNKKYVSNEFEKLHISQFARNIESLANKWFGTYNVESDGLLNELEIFILKNGIYGKVGQAKAIALEKNGRLKYVMTMAFPNLKSMQSLYPWLKGKAILLPVAWVIRMGRTALFRKNSISTVVGTVRTGDKKKGKELLDFYERCGIAKEK